MYVGIIGAISLLVCLWHSIPSRPGLLPSPVWAQQPSDQSPLSSAGHRRGARPHAAGEVADPRHHPSMRDTCAGHRARWGPTTQACLPPPPQGPTCPPAPTVTTRQARGSPRGAPTNQQLPPLPPPRVVLGVGGGGTGAGGRLHSSWQRVGRRRAAAGSHPTAAPLKGNGGVYGRQRARRRRPSSPPLPAAVRDPHRLVWARMFVLQSPVTTRHRPHTLHSSLTPATR